MVVQAIEVSWTKISRGGSLATLRNRVPEIALLPFGSSPPKSAMPIYIRHEITWGETNEFQQPLTGKIDIAEFMGQVKNRLLGFHAAGGTSIKVGFEKSYGANPVGKNLLDYTRLGAPARTVPLEIFSLGPGEWGRVRYNGRFSWKSGWKYEKWVYNIGLFADTIPENCFQGSPARSYSSLADLW